MKENKSLKLFLLEKVWKERQERQKLEKSYKGITEAEALKLWESKDLFLKLHLRNIFKSLFNLGLGSKKWN